MHCPLCYHRDTRVLASRDHLEGKQIKRRRVCMECNYRFSSYEIPEERVIRVVKRDESLQEFSASKLRDGVMRSLAKRPVSTEQIDQLIDNIYLKVFNNKGAVSSQQIGDWVLEELKQLDAVAFVRFASVYRSFKSVDEFMETIEKI